MQKVREVKIKSGKRTVTLTKGDLIDEYADTLGCSREDAYLAVDTVLNSIRSTFAQASHDDPSIQVINLVLTNFGKFSMKVVPEHERILNHMGGKKMIVPEQWKLSFAHATIWKTILKNE